MKIKKILITFAGIVFILLTAVFFLIIFPFIGTKKIETTTSFSGGKITGVADGMSQVFIIDGGGGQIGLVDAGNSADGKPVIDALKAKGYTASDVKSIFLTHGHRDHIAAASKFTNAKIYCLKNEVAIAEGIKNNPSPLGRLVTPKPTGIKVTGILKDKDIVSVGSLKVEAFSVPGHTEGSAAYLIDSVLIMGDTALAGSDGKIKHAVWAFSSDVDQQKRSLKALAALLAPRKDEVKTIAFSHSGHLDGLQPLLDYAAAVKD